MLTALSNWEWGYLFLTIPYTVLPELFTSAPFDAYPYSRHAAKCLPLLILMLWTLLSSQSLFKRVALTTALWFSLAGDWALVNSDQHAFFTAGVQYFRLSHLAYITLFASSMRQSSMGALVAFIVFIGSMTLLVPKLYARSTTTEPDYLFLIPSYAAAIVVMFYTAVGTLQADSRIAAAGALIFMLSDFCLSVNRFVTPLLGAHYIVHMTYYASQVLLTRAVISGSEVKAKKA
jgi:uncharacterized membrane protein YhhN